MELHDREALVVGFLDSASSLTALHVTIVGGLAAAIVEPRQVFKALVLANAAAILLAHNHPSARAEPGGRGGDEAARRGREDDGIPIHDHLIIAGHGYTSLAERGLL